SSRWAVGVARESVERKRCVELKPQNGFWGLCHDEGKFEALTDSPTSLSCSSIPRRIWVCLDCQQGLVSFTDGDTGAEIF
ncbi:TRI38 ligase, partial [Rhinopomastus cyanomelas]|nr:TRI38 ligase [Rhinopomastus cyanomelas]